MNLILDRPLFAGQIDNVDVIENTQSTGIITNHSEIVNQTAFARFSETNEIRKQVNYLEGNQLLNERLLIVFAAEYVECANLD